VLGSYARSTRFWPSQPNYDPTRRDIAYRAPELLGANVPLHDDDRLIGEYFWKIQVTAVRALEGENVKEEIKTIIAKALDQFDFRSTRNPAINRVAFKRKLENMASITHSSQPAQQEALEYAASLIPEEPCIKH
jgi:hypothetical protein